LIPKVLERIISITDVLEQEFLGTYEDITSANILDEELWQRIQSLISRASFVALDTEFTGLGHDKGLLDP